MNCTCFTKINESLKPLNQKLTGYTFIMPDFTLMPTVSTTWIDPSKAPKGQKKKPLSVIAPFCPFCGQAAKTKDGK